MARNWKKHPLYELWRDLLGKLNDPSVYRRYSWFGILSMVEEVAKVQRIIPVPAAHQWKKE